MCRKEELFQVHNGAGEGPGALELAKEESNPENLISSNGIWGGFEEIRAGGRERGLQKKGPSDRSTTERGKKRKADLS